MNVIQLNEELILCRISKRVEVELMIDSIAGEIDLRFSIKTALERLPIVWIGIFILNVKDESSPVVVKETCLQVSSFPYQHKIRTCSCFAGCNKHRIIDAVSKPKAYPIHIVFTIGLQIIFAEPDNINKCFVSLHL